MTVSTDVQQYIGMTAVDSEGDKVGKIEQVYLDDQTNEPVWVTVSTGLFGSRQSFAPLYGATAEGETVRLAVTKDLVKDAPNIEDDAHVTEGEQNALYQHYAGYLGNGQTQYETGTESGYADNGQGGYADDELAGDTTGVRGRDTSGPTTDDAMTRSEERLHVGTEGVEAGRARLRKYVVTENVTQTVPVSHEEVRLEREPISDANRDAALSGEPITEEEHEVTLHAEHPVVEKEAVPVERVRLTTDTVTEEAQVNETVRKEQIDEPDVDSNAGSRTDR
jgi:uncharacterized protein (TIGR02271 family)